jgi:WD40 repeat protein
MRIFRDSQPEYCSLRQVRRLENLMMKKTAILFFLILLMNVPCTASQWPSSESKGTHQAEIESKLDLGNQYIEQTAVIMARDYPGEFNINQAGAIYDSLVKGWSYMSDSSYESKKNANRSLQDGMRSGVIGVGDCEDFAILIASLIQSLGGSTCIIFSTDKYSKKHAYAELYLGKKGNPAITEIENFIKENWNRSSVPGLIEEDGNVWLNLDYNATYPGGILFGKGKAYPNPVWVSGNLTSPKIIPFIDSMDNLSSWNQIMDDLGSNVSIGLVPSKKAIELSYDLRENGYAGIAKDIEPGTLTDLRGINLSYLMNASQINLEVRLRDENGTSFSSSRIIQKDRTKWDYLEIHFDDLKRVDSGEPSSGKKDPSKFDHLEFIIHNRSARGNANLGSGGITLNQIRGVLRVPQDSPWELAERVRKTATASRLLVQSDMLRDETNSLTVSALLATEALRLNPSLEADQTLRKSLELLPTPLICLDYNYRVNALEFSPDGNYLATASDNKEVCIWDIRNGKLVSKLNHSSRVLSLSFSNSRSNLATGCDDGTAWIWDNYAQKNPIPRFIINDTGPQDKNISNLQIATVSLHPDAKYLVTLCEYDSEIRPYWDPVLGLERNKSLKHDSCIKMWNVTTGKDTMYLDPSSNYSSFAFSPNGRFFAVADLGSEDMYTSLTIPKIMPKIKVWDLELGHNIFIKECYAEDIAFSNNGQFLSARNASFTSIWDISSGNKIATIKDNGDPQSRFRDLSERYIEFTNNSDKIIEDEGTKTTVVSIPIDSGDGFEIDLVKIDSGSYNGFRYDKSNGLVANGKATNSVRIWNIENGDEFARIECSSGVTDFSFDPNGKFIAVSTSNNETCIWEANNGRLISRDKYIADYQEGDSIYLSIDKKFILNMYKDIKCAIALNIENGDELFNTSNISVKEKIIAFDPDFRYLVVLDDSSFERPLYRIYELITGKIIGNLTYNRTHEYNPYWGSRYLEGTFCVNASNSNNTCTSRINSLQAHISDEFLVSPNCRYIATTYGPEALIWSIPDLKGPISLLHESLIEKIAFDAEANHFVASNYDQTKKIGSIKIWELPSGRIKYNLSSGDPLMCISPNGKYFAYILSNISDNIILDRKGRAKNPRASVSLLDIQRSKIVGNLSINGVINYIDFNSDGSSLIIETMGYRPMESIWDSLDISRRNASNIPTLSIYNTTFFEEIGNYSEFSAKDIALSHNGNYAAILENDVVKIIDLSESREISQIDLDKPYSHISFSNNDIRLLTWGDEIAPSKTNKIAKMPSIWKWQTEDLIKEACIRINREFTNDEWNKYFGDEPYREVCRCD